MGSFCSSSKKRSRDQKRLGKLVLEVRGLMQVLEARTALDRQTIGGT